jgi:hypothetical protein
VSHLRRTTDAGSAGDSKGCQPSGVASLKIPNNKRAQALKNGRRRQYPSEQGGERDELEFQKMPKDGNPAGCHPL